MQTTRWKWLAALALALGVLVAAGCGDDNESASSSDTTTTAPGKSFAAGTTMARLQKEGEIAIGVKYDVPPFGVKNPRTNEIEGFDIDVGKAVAEALGVKPKFVEAISDNRIPFLKDGTADLILSTMTINAERAQEIDFSEPYFIARGRILVKKDSDIAGVDDLGGKKVCTVLGSTYEDTLKKQAPKAERKLVDTYPECLELVQNGAVDAESTDDTILSGQIKQDDTLKMVGEPLTTEPYGAGIKKGDKAFQDVVNEAIAAFKQDGRWAAAYQKWIGQYTGEKPDPPTMTLQEAINLTT